MQVKDPRYRLFHWLAAALLAQSGAVHAADFLHEPPEQRDARMAWFREARFGMFIHWGVYAVPAGEWQGKTHYAEWFLEQTHMPVSQYERFAQQFNPTRFDARQWVRLAKEAGMRYLVITSKHHDGFCLWPTKLTDWCIRATPFRRDPLGELAQACREEGIRLCFYYSIMDWHHPDYAKRRPWNDRATGEPDMDRYVAYMKGQLKELITRYGPLGILWFDGQWEDVWTAERGRDLYNYVRSLQPDIIINNRVGRGDVGDYGTPEQRIPATGLGPGVDWESCMTMNDHWGYNKHDHNWKSPTTLVRNLIDCASKGGNYLLNIGPTAEGLFPEPCVERLRAIGRWMKTNGESIYGTQASPFRKTPWGRATRKPGVVYLHVFDWPADGRLQVPLRNEVKRVRALESPEATFTVSRREGQLLLQARGVRPNPMATVLALEIEGEPDPVVVYPEPDAHGRLVLSAPDAIIQGHTARLENKGGRPNIGFWTDTTDRVQFQARFRRPARFRVQLDYALSPSSEGSRIRLSAGQASLEATLHSTGGWDRFQTLTLGELEIRQPGILTLEITPLAKPGEGVMNLRELTLTATP